MAQQLSNAKHTAYLTHMQGRGAQSNAQRSASFQYTPNPELVKQADQASAKAMELRKQRESHPHHGQFMKAAEKHYKLVRGGNYGE